MAKDPYRYFRIEANELLDQLAKGVLDLEKGSFSAALVLHLLRLAHTLKGAARVVKQSEIADHAHRLEDTLAPYRDGAQLFPRQHVDSALAALDAIATNLAQLPVPDSPTNNSPKVSMPAQESTARIVRADLLEVDMMLEGLGEIGNELGGMRRTVDLIEGVQKLNAQSLQQQLISPAKLKSVAEQMQTMLSKIELNMSAGIQRIDRELREVRDAAGRLRLTPISGIFNTLERTARDAAHSTGKQIEFLAIGGEVRIDGTILDTVQSVLIQLVRNAVAHGIETNSKREVLGKPVSGQVTLAVERRGSRAWFCCKDDGAGIDIDAVRRALSKKGVSEAEIKKLDADALMALLLQGGISTSSVVTEISGRGIGLDLVREAMVRLGGEIIAKSLPERGTAFELSVPLLLSALDVLIVEHDDYVAAVPLDSIRSTLRITPEEILHTVNGEFILYEDKQIPYAPLRFSASLTDGQTKSASNPLLKIPARTTVVVAAAGAFAALAVERLCGVENIVLRTLTASCPADPIVLGVYLDDEGNPRPVLDPDVLVTQRWSGNGNVAAAAQKKTAAVPILIIDDSLTTRMLESSILESAGYVVEMAVCAEDGMEMAKNRHYALFLVDVEMPGMDGFSFVEKIQTDSVLRDTPCILVSSRDASEDRQRGLASGARAYIVKGEFDQIEFLELIAKLVQR